MLILDIRGQTKLRSKDVTIHDSVPHSSLAIQRRIIFQHNKFLFYTNNYYKDE